MEAQKKETIQYQKNIEGFSREGLSNLEKKLTHRELMLLKTIIVINNNYSLQECIIKGKRYVWISYSLILNSFNGLYYSYKMLQKDLDVLDSLGLINRYVENYVGKSRVFFYLTDVTRNMYLFAIK